MDEVVRQVLEAEHGLKIGRRIGRGGFGEVYQAESAQGVPCALKVSLDPLDDNNSAVKKELENLGFVRTHTGHPHIVSLMDFWLVSGYLVTRWELATHGNLLDLLHRYAEQGQAGIPERKLLRYMIDAAEGIDFLNGLGIYHCDIKPANLLLFHGRVKLGDLGLAKFAGVSTASHSGSGTLGYLPPEAFDQHRLSKTIDLYSLAASYVKLRTGRESFGDTPREIIRRQTEGKPILDGLSAAEAEAVRQALAPRPEDRPQQGAFAWVKCLYELWAGARLPPLPVPREPVVQLGHTGSVDSAQYSPDGRRIVLASGDGTTRVWDARSGQEVVRFFANEQGDWLAVTPKGYFVASQGAERLVRHSDGQGGLIPEEESLRYHRPDLVQKALAAAEAN
ncbi:MAG: serine/threonine protein kinase [Thermoguttaceae bacterium]